MALKLKIVDIIPNYRYELSRFFSKSENIEKGWEKFVRKVKFKTPFRKFFVEVDKKTYKIFDSEDINYNQLIALAIKFIDVRYAHLGFDYKSLSKKVVDSAYIEDTGDRENMLYLEIIDVPKYISNNYKPE